MQEDIGDKMRERIRRMTWKRSLINIIWLTGLIIISREVIIYINPDSEKWDFIDRAESYTLTKSLPIQASVTAMESDRGAAYVELNGSQILTFKFSINYNYEEPWLNKFLKQGDFLYKNAGSDTLWITRNEKKYYFIVGEFIGNE